MDSRLFVDGMDSTRDRLHYRSVRPVTLYVLEIIRG